MYQTDYREYHPTLGRWTSEDPIDYVGGPNLYSYCNDNPAVTTDPSGLMDLEKVERGIAGLFEGAIEFLSASDTAIPSAMMAKGYGDFLLGINKTVQGLRDKPGLGAPASVAEGVVDAVSLGLTGERSQTARDLIDVADSMFSGAASGYLRGAAARGPKTQEEYMRFRGQGFTPAQAKYLTQPYDGVGHHLIPRRWGLPEAVLENPLNVMKPEGISVGRFYERHFLADPHFNVARFPSAIGGNWESRMTGLQRPGFAGRLWYGSPQALKLTTGGTAAAGGAAALYRWVARDEQ